MVADVKPGTVARFRGEWGVIGKCLLELNDASTVGLAPQSRSSTGKLWTYPLVDSPSDR